MTSPLKKVILDVLQVNSLAYLNAVWGYAAWLLRMPRPYSLPRNLDLVLTKACNLRCTFCISYDSFEGKHWMDFRLYEQIARKLFPTAHSIFFCSGGEPLLYPKLREALRLARKYKVFSIIASNGTLLNRETARWMVGDQSLHELIISFDGAKKETLERIRRGASYEIILDNIDFLSALKRKKGLIYPRLSLRYTIMKSNAEELPEIFKICSQYGISKVKVNYLNVSNEIDVHESLFFHPELTTRVFSESRHWAKEWGIQLELPPLPEPGGRQRRCSYPWKFALIEPDGSIRFCYHSWRQRLGFFSDGFSSLWRGDSYQKIRRTMDSPNPYYPYCRFCSVRLGFNWESSHNQRIKTESYVIPGLEHLQTSFNQRFEENVLAFTEFNEAP